MTIIEKIKSSLFELTYVLDRTKRKEIMQMLAVKLKELLNANGIVFYMYNKYKLDDQITYYSSDENSFVHKMSDNTFIDMYEHSSNVSILTEDHPLQSKNHHTSVLLKISESDYTYSFVTIYFKEKPELFIGTFEKLRNVLEQFLTNFFNNRHYQYEYNRYQLMFELSTKLHSVHHTREVLEEVNDTTKIVYPNYSYYFLMAHEVEYGSLPVKIIEYSKGTSINAGIISLINNELQFEIDEEKQVTNIYSPMSGSQGVYGVFQLTIPKVVDLIDREIEFMKKYTNMIGRAIERTTLYQSSNQQVTDLQIINDASHELNASLQLDEITETVKKQIYHSCQAEQIGIVLFEPSEDTEGYQHIIKISDSSTDFFKTSNGKNFVDIMYNRMEVKPKSFLSGDYQAEFIEFPYKSLMVIPMKTSASLLGMIIIAHEKSYYFSFDKYKFIQSLVQHASLAFTNSILTERLKRIATTDHLTKLYSRSHFDQLIQDYMKENERGALILFDVDDFKKINDTYGHYIGDKVLIQVANIIQSEIQGNEIAARWGGEEFAIYLSDSTLSESIAKANTIREKVMEQTEPQVSLSCGVSTWDQANKYSIEKLFIKADKALYKAKASGKNKVVPNVEVV